MKDFRPKNWDEWKLQTDFVLKHMGMGGVPVFDTENHALIRFEYENPIFGFYKGQYDETMILMEELTGMMNDISAFASPLLTASTPTKTQKIKARIYKPNTL